MIVSDSPENVAHDFLGERRSPVVAESSSENGDTPHLASLADSCDRAKLSAQIC